MPCGIFLLMRKEIKEIIKIPEGIETEIEDRIVTIKKGPDILKRKLEVDIRKEGNSLVLHNPRTTKKEKKIIKSTAAHLRNMISGLQEKYVYKLKVCFVHFPVSVELKPGELIIKNFLGEKNSRKAKILPGSEVKIEKDEITVTSHSKELAGQTAANIENSTRIKARDRRIFQDGIFIIEKPKGKTRCKKGNF